MVQIAKLGAEGVGGKILKYSFGNFDYETWQNIPCILRLYKVNTNIGYVLPVFKKIFFLSFCLFAFIELYIFLRFLLFLLPSLLPSPMIPMLAIYSGDLVFFYYLSRLGPCMSLLGSSFLSLGFMPV